jgi:hypothetical protein
MSYCKGVIIINESWEQYGPIRVRLNGTKTERSALEIMDIHLTTHYLAGQSESRYARTYTLYPRGLAH